MKLVLALLLSVVVSTIVPVFASAPALQAQRNYALYTVRSGDTLVSIAQRYNISSQRLADFNALEGALIHPGDLLKVPYLEGRGGVAEPPPAPPPGFRVHRLASGETISAVLSNYGVSLEALIGANPDLSSLDRLPEGSELFIPPAHLPEGMLVALEPEQSLLDILDIYGVHPVALARANNIRDPLALREGQLLFSGPLDRPQLYVEAVRRVERDDVTAGLRLEGNPEEPRVSLFSEPAMGEEDVLSYIILGRPAGQGGGDDNMLGRAALALGMAGGSGYATALAEEIGIQDFTIDTEGDGDDTQVVVGGYINPNLYLGYGVGVFTPVNTLTLRYQLATNLYLEAVTSLESAIDLLYRFEFGSRG